MYISILISISISISIYLSTYRSIDRSIIYLQVWNIEISSIKLMPSFPRGLAEGTPKQREHGVQSLRHEAPPKAWALELQKLCPPQKREVVTADARQHMHPSMPGWYLQSVDNSTVVTPHKGDVFYIIRYHSQSPKITMNSVKHCRTIHSQLFFSENVVNPPPSMVYQVEHL